MSGRRRLALHWRILIGLVLGVAAGLATNLAWGPATWRAIGVDHVPAYLAGVDRVPVLPDGVSRVSDLDPSNDALKGLKPYEMTPEQIERYGLATHPVNEGARFAAGAARFVRRAVELVGHLFLRGLKFIAVPIVLFSLIVGTSSLNDLAKLSRIGGKTVAIYLCTTALAITVGLVIANAVGPGRLLSEATRARFESQMAGAEQTAVGSVDLWSFIERLIPDNPFAAIARADMLQVVVAGLLVGVALTLIPKAKSAPVVAFFDGMTDVVIKLVDLLMLAAPYAVFALIAPVIADLGLSILGSLVGYSLCVVGGLAVMIFVVYPLALRLLSRVGFGRFYRAIAPAQLLAFSSSSSSATLPVTMECCEQRLGIGEEVASFVLPVGATVNMDGTALYQGVAAVFIAQMFNMDLTVVQQLTIVLTATLASIGTAGVPGAGLVMLVIVLQSVGIPTSGIAVILGVDRVLDMCRTACNVTGDCMVAAVVAASERALLSENEVERLRAASQRRGLDQHPQRAGA